MYRPSGMNTAGYIARAKRRETSSNEKGGGRKKRKEGVWYSARKKWQKWPRKERRCAMHPMETLVETPSTQTPAY